MQEQALQFTIDIIVQTRKNILNITAPLSTSQLQFVPQGSRNHILWHLGHIVSIQQQLMYRSTGHSSYVDDLFIGMFKKGSAPAEWNTIPDIKMVRAKIEETSQKLKQDFNSGYFKSAHLKMKYVMPYGITIAHLEQTIPFILTHEAVHYGIISQYIKGLLAPAQS